MNDETRYKGWKNYQTWRVKCHINNDIESDELWKERARDLIEKKQESLIWDLADEIGDVYDEDAPIFEMDVWGDLFWSALGIVEWNEIAESIINEVKKEDE